MKEEIIMASIFGSSFGFVLPSLPGIDRTLRSRQALPAAPAAESEEKIAPD